MKGRIFDKVSHRIIGNALDIHKALGPGLLENCYKECLYYELIKSGFTVEKEKPIPLIYEEVKLDQGYRVDLLVNNSVVIEIKCVDSLASVHYAQVLTYMKIGGFRTGLLFNFNTYSLKDGIKRFVL